MADTLSIFSYGSNMSFARLFARVPSAQFIRKGYLPKHQLKWHKHGRDGSGKCDAYFTGRKEHQIWGGVFDIAVEHKHLLDKAEGLGVGYTEKPALIHCQDTPHRAILYVALHIDDRVKPFNWYKNFVVTGALECALPVDYVEQLRAVAAIDDPDSAREEVNKAILSDRTHKL